MMMLIINIAWYLLASSLYLQRISWRLVLIYCKIPPQNVEPNKETFISLCYVIAVISVSQELEVFSRSICFHVSVFNVVTCVIMDTTLHHFSMLSRKIFSKMFSCWRLLRSCHFWVFDLVLCFKRCDENYNYK